MRGLFPHEPDISGGIVFAHAVLDGLRPYVDLSDPNPPMIFLLYLPGALLERWTSLNAEMTTHGITIALAIAATAMGEAALGRLERAGVGAFRIIVTLTILLIVPMRTFSERDHVAFIAMWPMLTILCARAEGRVVEGRFAFFAGVLAGLGVAIKPYLVLGPLAALIALAIAERSLRAAAAGPEVRGLGLSSLFAAACFALAFPEYFGPSATASVALYAGLRKPDMILSNGSILWIVAAMYVATISKPHRTAWMLLAASLGFSFALFGPGKGFPYHSLSMLSSVLAALLFPRGEARPRILALATGLPLLGLTAGWMLLTSPDRRPLEDFVRSVAPPSPVIGVLSVDISVGHPLTRNIGGRWANPNLLLWMTWGAHSNREGDQVGDVARRVSAYVPLETRMLSEAWQRTPPDIILIGKDFDWVKWASPDPFLAGELAVFEQVGEVEDVAVWRRGGLQGVEDAR